MSGRKSTGRGPIEVVKMLDMQEARKDACRIVTTDVMSSVISLLLS